MIIIDRYILDIYIFNSWNLDCETWVSWSFFFFCFCFFCKTTIIRQLKKLNESKIEKNTVKKLLGF